MSNNSDPCARQPEQSWTPLEPDQIPPAACLIFFGFLYSLFHLFVTFAQLKVSFTTPTFIVLYSMSVAEIGTIVTTGMILGFQILLRTNIFPYNVSWWSSAVLNFFWFSMSYHYPLIAFTRFAAVFFLTEVSEILSAKKCLLYVGATWIAGTITDIIFHAIPDQTQPVFFDYHNGGYHAWSTWDCNTSFWTYYNGICTFLSCVFYVAAVTMLVARRIDQVCSFKIKIIPKIANNYTTTRIYNTSSTVVSKIISVAPSNVTNMPAKHEKGSSRGCKCKYSLQIEYRLLAACFLNGLMFQIASLMGTYVKIFNNWGNFLPPFLISTNSTVDPLLLMIFSSELRKAAASQFSYVKKLICGK